MKTQMMAAQVSGGSGFLESANAFAFALSQGQLLELLWNGAWIPDLYCIARHQNLYQNLCLHSYVSGCGPQTMLCKVRRGHSSVWNEFLAFCCSTRTCFRENTLANSEITKNRALLLMRRCVWERDAGVHLLPDALPMVEDDWRRTPQRTSASAMSLSRVTQSVHTKWEDYSRENLDLGMCTSI